MKTSIAFLLGMLLTTSAYAVPITLTVAGTSDPWLAAAGPGATASTTDVFELHGPVAVHDSMALISGSLLKFEVTGGVLNTPLCLAPFTDPPCVGPDGAETVQHREGGEHGIANVFAPLNSLLGVFLGGGPPPPVVSTLPAVSLPTDFSFLAPNLGQVFFIGDGNDGSGNDQHFLVPDGATRFFLATMDGFEWANNSGRFIVTIDLVEDVNPETTVPEPTTFALVGLGLVARRFMKKKARV